MKWEDVIRACESLDYTPEDLLEMIQIAERAREVAHHELLLECLPRG